MSKIVQTLYTSTVLYVDFTSAGFFQVNLLTFVHHSLSGASASGILVQKSLRIGLAIMCISHFTDIQCSQNESWLSSKSLDLQSIRDTTFSEFDSISSWVLITNGFFASDLIGKKYNC